MFLFFDVLTRRSTRRSLSDAIMAPRIEASHWSPASAPTLRADAPGTGPPAGGSVVTPRRGPPAADRWEHELRTTLVRTGDEPRDAAPAPDAVKHRGGCHCGAVRFEALAPTSLVVWDCNCSDCRMRRNLHFVVPADALTLIVDERGGEGGAAALAEYRWGSGTARHLFCSRCGICPFYRARSNPSGWAVTFQCLDAGTVAHAEVRCFDGVHWEDEISGAGGAIRAFSETAAA